jgi:hypothetical protein
MAIIMSVLLWFTDSDYTFGIFKLFLWSPFILFPLAIVMYVFLWFTDSDYTFGIFKLFLWSPFVLFHLVIVMYVLWFTDSDYTFGIFKRFVNNIFLCITYFKLLLLSLLNGIVLYIYRDLSHHNLVTLQSGSFLGLRSVNSL